MAFVITVLLLMLGTFVVMMFQTRMQQQELAEQLSRLQKEVERLRRQPAQEQRLAESEHRELLPSKNEHHEPRQHASGLPENAPGKAQPDFNSWPYNPNAPTATAAGAAQPNLKPAAFERIPSGAETASAQSAYFSAHAREADAVRQPLPASSEAP